MIIWPHFMRISLRASVIIALALSSQASGRKLLAARMPQNEEVPTPFTLMSEVKDDGFRRVWKAIFYVPKEQFNQSNLEVLFKWYARKHRDAQDDLEAQVFTRRMSGLAQTPVRMEQKKTAINTKEGVAAHTYDALFLRERHQAYSGTGKNEWYTYFPNLEDRSAPQTVILRGRQPYAIETQVQMQDLSKGYVKLRFTKFKLAGVYPEGGYITAAAYSERKRSWDNKITIIQQQDSTLSSDNIHILTDRIAYFYLQGLYLVTVDEGRSWHTWEPADAEHGQVYKTYLIKDVKVQIDGQGWLALDVGVDQHSIVLRTINYGMSWSIY